MTDDEMRKLYEDPRVVIAMDVLRRHGVTGAQYEVWVQTRDHASLGWTANTHCVECGGPPEPPESLRCRDCNEYPEKCDARTPGNCYQAEESLLHDCYLSAGHNGRHYCECGRNWPDSDNYEPAIKGLNNA